MDQAAGVVGTDATQEPNLNYPVVDVCTMSKKMKSDTLEVVSTACELYSGDYLALSAFIKKSMDKNYGSMWHVVAGETYGIEIEHAPDMLMFLFYGGKIAICIWQN